MAAEIRSAPTRSLRRRDGLIQFARDETSQNGEDGVIAAIFACLDKRQRPKTRWCVDVGAWDGVHLSNTHTLLTAGGWRGALLEADAERCAKLRELHAPLGNVAIEAFVSCVDASRSVESLLRKHAKSVPLGVDLVSVDVDGCDYWIFKDLLESGYGSRVYVVEFNPTIPHDVVYVQPRSDATRHGSSLAALVDLGKKSFDELVAAVIHAHAAASGRMGCAYAAAVSHAQRPCCGRQHNQEGDPAPGRHVLIFVVTRSRSCVSTSLFEI